MSITPEQVPGSSFTSPDASTLDFQDQDGSRGTTIIEEPEKSIRNFGGEEEDEKRDVELAVAAQPVSVPAPLDDGPPDGGYGWVVAVCQFFINFATWGYASAYGVFLSFYRETNFFPGATDIEFALIGGLLLSVAFLTSPLSNFLSKTYGFRIPMSVGVVIFTLGQIFAGLSTKIWQLFLTQGVMFGLGVGLVYMPTLPVLTQWFNKRRGLANGLASGGAGAGALVISILTRNNIQKLSLKWAFIINGLIAFALLTPSVLLMKTRVHATGAKFEPLQPRWLWHKGYAFVLLWFFFSVLGYIIAIYSVATYATAGLGLSQTLAANIQAITCGFQIIGRPGVGLSLDRFGRINGGSGATLIAGLSCLLIWIFADSYGLLIFFSVIQGLTGGTLFATCGSITAEVVGVKHIGSAMAIMWLVGVLPSTFAEPIGLALVDYSTNHLGWTGRKAFEISICFSGGSFIVAAIVLMGAKRHVQGNWNMLTKA
ncbi:MFS general substrate transporter [Sistotremastrum niveocremeum HHB9708]|uniref:MFS general substrate transporter n=1 Tax=Sistotremastrum niveocremeum HHB9708 TaxID=1314777 RepID=A0A164PE57_9AGAM|nr:MFS general substrate transporter [Sistotremastrum niveocremeum HHB9708]